VQNGQLVATVYTSECSGSIERGEDEAEVFALLSRR
jgi:hypothetical protein